MTRSTDALWQTSVLPLAAIGWYLWLVAGVAIGVVPAVAVALARRRQDPGARVGAATRRRTAPTELARAGDANAVARLLLDHTQELVGVEMSGLVLVDEDGRRARGFLGRSGGEDLDWYPGLEFDLESEPSGIATAVLERAPFTIVDATGSRQVSRYMTDAIGAKSIVYIPLLGEERVLGVLVIASTTEHRAFTADELLLLQGLADEAAGALERLRTAARLAEALARERRRIVRQRGLVRAAEAFTSDLDLDMVLQRLVHQLAELLEADAADCYLLDRDRHVLRCAAVHGLPESLLGFEFPTDRGLAATALREGQIATSDRYALLDDPVQEAAYAEFTTAAVAPMRWAEEVHGVLGVGFRSRSEFGEEESELLEAYAGLASLVLANAQAFEARARQARVQRGFFRIASVLGQSLSLHATLDAVAHAAIDALGGSFAAVFMPRKSSLDLVAAAGLPEALTKALSDGLPESARSLRVAAAEGRVLASTEIRDDDRFEPEWAELVDAVGARALLSIPLASSREQGNGTVVVFFAGPRVFADEDLELARHVADAAQGALERSELFEAERAARALSQELARTGGVLATELDPNVVLDEVVRRAPELLGADACLIRTAEEEALVVSAGSGPGTDDVVGTRVPSRARLSGDVFQSRGPVAIEDTTGDGRLAAADPLLATGYGAFLGVPLTGPEGTPLGVLAVYGRRPRTWRPEETEALRALAANTSAALANAELYSRVSLEKERSVAILANIADGIVAVDRDGEVVLWNEAAEAITGVPAEEALGRTPMDVLERTLESEASAAGPRLVSISRGGEEVWLSLSETVMRDPLGTVAGRIFAFRDISADRMVEQIKSDFVAAVSHELRTPLTSIYGFAETLLRQDVPFGEDDRRTFLRYIASESDRLTEIVDQLLNVARLDAGDLHVEPRPIDVGSVVSEVMETVGEIGPANGHRFEIDLPSEPLAAEADADKLRQVFSILVENAVKYSPGGGTVTVGARRGNGTVEVRVVDEGVGIPASEQARIFRKFYRAESTVRSGGGGTGLGLFIAKELVTAMGGRIWVESSEGEGSKFAFELPAARV